MVAVIFMAVASVMLIDMVSVTKEVATTNLRNTCYNATSLGSPNADNCWEDYSRISGEPRPANAGSTATQGVHP